MVTDQQKIKHLYHRAGFGLSPVGWHEKKDWSINDAVRHLFAEAEKRDQLEAAFTDYIKQGSIRMEGLSKEDIAELRLKGRLLVSQLGSDWIKRMSSNNHPALLERVTLFWHGHFACESKLPHFALNQLNTIRSHALGSFRDLMLAIAKDGSMIRYLNNQQNKKQSPNENFARELLELFTLGISNYTEKDIKEAARAFTGWGSNMKGEFVFRKYQHDIDEKTFMGKTGNFNGEDIIDIILEKKETARFISTKVYRYFVNEEINQVHVEELADTFYQSGYDIKTMMEMLFTSDWFYEEQNIGTKIKSPVELIAGMMNHLGIKWQNGQALTLIQKALGQQLFRPPNVAGWPGGRSWIDNTTLMTRLNIGTLLYKMEHFQFQVKGEEEKPSRLARKMRADLDLEPLIKMTQKRNKEEAIRILSDFLVAGEMNLDHELFTSYNHGDDSTVYAQVILRMISTPEYQMC